MRAYAMPDDLRRRVVARVDECWETLRARKYLSPDAPAPVIRFYTGRAAAGLAHPREHWVAFNGPLLLAHPESMLRQTVAHEVAHCAADGIYSVALWCRRRVAPHGAEWRHLMRVLGVPPDVTHNYDLTAAGVNVRRVARVAYVCGCAGRVHQITPVRVRKIAAGTVYRCKSCRIPLALARNVDRADVAAANFSAG